MTATTPGVATGGTKFSNIGYFVRAGWCFVSYEGIPKSNVENRDIVATGFPTPYNPFFLSLGTASGNSYTAMMRADGTLEIYFSSYTTASRIDTCFVYPVAL